MLKTLFKKAVDSILPFLKFLTALHMSYLAYLTFKNPELRNDLHHAIEFVGTGVIYVQFQCMEIFERLKKQGEPL